MGQVENIKQMRKSRSRKRALKKFFVLIFLCLLMLVGYILWETVKDFDIKTRIDDMLISMGRGPGFPVSIAGREAISLYEVSGMPALLNDSNNFLYNEKGKTVTNIQHGFHTPIAKGAGGKIMIFDMGGRGLKIYSRSRQLFEKNFDNNIINADICETGAFAVASNADLYKGEVHVYNEKGHPKFVWRSAGNVITDLSLSPNGQHLAVTTINSDNGGLVSSLSIFRAEESRNSEDNARKIDFIDEYPIMVNFKNNGTVSLVTDKAIRNYTTSGREMGQYDYNDRNLYDYDVDDAEYSALVFSDAGIKPVSTVIVLNEKNEVVNEITVEEKVLDIGVDDQGCFITCEDKIVFINLEGKETDRLDTPLIKKTLVIGPKVYYTTHNMVYKDTAKRVLE